MQHGTVLSADDEALCTARLPGVETADEPVVVLVGDVPDHVGDEEDVLLRVVLDGLGEIEALCDGDAGGGGRGVIRGRGAGGTGDQGECGIVLGDQPVQPPLEVVPRRRMGVLLDGQAGRGVLEKHRAETLLHAARAHHLGHLAGDLVEPLAFDLEVEAADHGGDDSSLSEKRRLVVVHRTHPLAVPAYEVLRPWRRG